MSNIHGLLRADKNDGGAGGLIARTVGERFPGAVNSVFVGTDADSDGDKIYRIYVAFDDHDASRLGAELFSFLPHLRERLEASHDDGFPVISFISRDDLTKLKLVPA